MIADDLIKSDEVANALLLAINSRNKTVRTKAGRAFNKWAKSIELGLSSPECPTRMQLEVLFIACKFYLSQQLKLAIQNGLIQLPILDSLSYG